MYTSENAKCHETGHHKTKTITICTSKKRIILYMKFLFKMMYLEFYKINLICVVFFKQ
jgi:hypothetical protein